MSETLKRLALLLLVCHSGAALAQDKTALFKGEIHHSGYCDMSIKFTQVDGNTTSLPGIDCAWLMNDRFYIGGSLYGTMNQITALSSNYSQAGLIVGYYFKPERLWHFSTELFVGKGILSPLTTYAYTVYEPSVSLNLNLTSFAKTRFTLGYRMIDGVDSGYGPAQLNGVVVSIGLLINPFEITYPKIKTDQA